MDTNPKFKFLLNEDLPGEFLPTRAKPKDTGWDVRSAVPGTMVIKPFQHVLIDLGFRIIAPEGYWLNLKPRSSSFLKLHMNCLYGVIDQSYTGSCMLAAQYIPEVPCVEIKDTFKGSRFKIDESALYNPLVISHGDRIGQVVPVKRQEMDVERIFKDEFLDHVKENGERGGFGHSGKR